MGGVVATEGRCRGDNSAKLGLGVAGRRVGGDLFAQALDVPDAVGYLCLAELDLQRCPAAVAKLDDDVDLQPVRIAVVAKRSGVGAAGAPASSPSDASWAMVCRVAAVATLRASELTMRRAMSGVPPFLGTLISNMASRY